MECDPPSDKGKVTQFSLQTIQSFIHSYMSIVNVLILKHIQNIKTIVCTRSNLLVELYLVIPQWHFCGNKAVLYKTTSFSWRN